MAKIYFLGTCSGTEPMPGMNYCSLIIEVDGVYYWFDAGEGCSRSAYTLGLNVLNTRALFISHPHIDHIGGLANLFFCLDKLVGCYGKPMLSDNTLHVYFPDSELLQSVEYVARGCTVNYDPQFKLVRHTVQDGIIYRDENVKVSAVHNTHMDEDGSCGWHAFSYLIETEGKRIVYSGDVGKPCELDSFILNGCDFLIMETGHHTVADICKYAVSRGVKALRFNHHGMEIIKDRAAAEKMTSDYAAGANISIKLAYDGMVEQI